MFAYLYHLKPLAARMLLVSGINAARERTTYTEKMHLQLSCYDPSTSISNVTVKNTGSGENNNHKLMLFSQSQFSFQNQKRRVSNRNRAREH